MGRIRTYAGCTLNNPTEDEIEKLRNLDESKFKWAIFALETGEEGTEHVQAAWSFKHAKTFEATKKFLGSNRWHFEEMRSTAFSAYAYCFKGEQSKEDWESEGIDGETYGKNVNIIQKYGKNPEKGDGKECIWTEILGAIQNGWKNYEICAKWPSVAMRCQAALDRYRLEWESSQAEWRDVKVEYWWGPTGTGKTRQALYDENGKFRTDVYRATNSKHPFDKYDGQDVLVIEEFRSQWSCRDMLNWLDGHPLHLPARYADRMAQYTKVIIISNWEFGEQYTSVQDNSPATWEAFKRRVGEVRYLGLNSDQEG